ncbi:MAG: hypothetical protein ABJH68_00395 [Ilumatobacter sp.]|uniref:hypothetical protein n=1 Tax=Ilumatobacter sp. TaxID=1967498 RepID=UPI003297BE15
MGKRSLSVVAERPVIAMCMGKDCAKRRESAKMRNALETECDVVDLKCVGLCDGPVVAIDPGARRPVVYSKLRSKRQRRLVIAAALGERRARRDLAERSVDRSKAVTRVSRQTRRRLAARTATT